MQLPEADQHLDVNSIALAVPESLLHVIKQLNNTAVGMRVGFSTNRRVHECGCVFVICLKISIQQEGQPSNLPLDGGDYFNEKNKLVYHTCKTAANYQKSVFSKCFWCAVHKPVVAEYMKEKQRVTLISKVLFDSAAAVITSLPV